ncbi:MAG: DNA polymerase III subunit delta' [Pseudomonadota bacterium]
MARRAQTPDIETLPEADRVAPFPHPRMTQSLHGHADAAEQLEAALDSGRAHHAWLVTGPQGIGKSTLSYFAARYALSEHAERATVNAQVPLAINRDGPTWRQVAAMAHPGLLVLRRPYDQKEKRFRAVITVDEVRRLRDFFAHTAAGTGRRVVLIDRVDELNISAANALLKSLEEPPTGALFLLISSNPGRLLPTIRSRCRTLTLAPLSETASEAALRQAFETIDAPLDLGRDVDAGTALAEVLSAAKRSGFAGQPGRMASILAMSGTTLAAMVDDVFKRLPSVDWDAVHRLADNFARADQLPKFELFATLFLDRLHGVVRAQITDMAGPDQGGGLSAPQLARLAETWETAARALAGVEALNLDRRTFVIETVSATAQSLKR